MQYFSSRRLEEALKTECSFYVAKWHECQDHNTINRFRSERLKDEIRNIFTQVVLLLEPQGHVSLKTVFTDGTKTEANANRYTFVWGRAIEKNKQRIEEQLEDVWQYTQEVAKIKSKDKTEVEFKAIDKELVEKPSKK